MKRTLIASTVLLFVLSASAVVGGPEPSEGELAITSEGSSASGTSAVGPNGTSYSTYFSVVNKSSQASDPGVNNMTGVINSSFGGDKVSFTGIVETPTPCYKLTHSVSEGENESYNFSVNLEEENGTCIQVLAYHKYEAEFEAEEPYQLKVNHGNETVKTLTHQDYDTTGPDPRPQPEQNQGPISKLVNWVKNFFSDKPETVTYQADEVDGQKIKVEER